MNLVELAPGLYPGIPHATYHQRVPGLVSKTVLDLVDRSAQHYQAWLGGVDREPTPALEFGSAFHMAVLEPELFMQTYVVEPVFGDCRKTANKAKRDAWRLMNGWDPVTESLGGGRKLISADDVKAINGMFKAVHLHPLASKMIADGRSELTVKWTDAETGLMCKARADYYVERLDSCFDLKSAEDARADAFGRSVASYRYHVQHAHYASGFAAVGRPLRHFVFIAVEKKAPYAIALYNLDEQALSRGYGAMRRNLDTIAGCIETGTYPGYDTSIQTLSLPPWA